MTSKLSVLVLVVVLTAFAATPIAAAPLAGPCAPSAAYDPACDVNHDGAVNVLDVQLTAGHWNQNGTWISDNDHNHLGQTWTGNNNPLRIQGDFGSSDNAPLVLSNSVSAGHGLIVSSAGNTGVSINSAGNDGLSVGFANGDGLAVLSAGDHGLNVTSTGGNGVTIGTAQSDGVHVDWALHDGFFVCQAGGVGACTPSAVNHGLEVGNAQGDGVRVTDADGDGIQIGDGTLFPATGVRIPSPGTPGDAFLPNTSDANGQWALFTTDDIQAGNIFASAQTLVAVVGGDQALAPGDVVAALGTTHPIPGSHNRLARVHLAGVDQANIVGVVSGRMALQPLPGGEGDQDLRSVAGPAHPGDYVAITVLGVAQVKVQAGEAIRAGQRLTVADTSGHARALRTVEIEGVEVDESGPTLGAALDAADKNGMVWVLVNPQ